MKGIGRTLILLLAVMIAGSAAALEPCAWAREPEAGFVTEIHRDTPVSEAWFEDAWLMGDSITESLANYDVLPTLPILSRIGQSPQGAMNNHVYEAPGRYRTMAEEIVFRAPKKLLVMLGSNGIDNTRLPVVLADYHRLVDFFAENLPETDIYLLAVTPVGPKVKERYRLLTMDNIRAFNAEMREMARTHGMHYIDLFTPLLSEDGLSVREGLSTRDGIHLSGEGAAVAAETIRMSVDGN